MNRLTILMACLAAGGASADLVDDVRCREIAFARSVENHDMAAFRTFIDRDARFVGNTVMRGTDEVAAAWQAFFEEGGPSIRWRPQFVEVLEDGSLALTRGPYHYAGKDADGNAIEQWGTFNSIWRKDDDGAWHIVFDAGSPAASAPGDEVRALLDAEEDGC